MEDEDEMKTVAAKSAIVLLAFLLVCTFPIGFVQAANTSQKDHFTPSFARENVDDFGYRFSFRLSDGVEALFIRGSYWLQYGYSNNINEAPNRRHTMYANLGFYYGKTVLGRSIVRVISVDSVAFYPKWTDSAGYPHDLYDITPMFMINDVIPDDAHVFTGMRIDEHAVSSYMPYFGGTLSFKGLSFVLDDGTEIAVGDLDIEILKYSNELQPQATLSNYPLTITFAADADVLVAISVGTAPLIHLVDNVLAAILVATIGTLFVLGYLHRKGRIQLPLGKARSLLGQSSPSPTGN
jgi:hypothetical protein